MKKYLIMLVGFLFGIFNLIPLPWKLRVLYLRFLYFVTVNGTKLFPSILGWTKQQNVKYKMGKTTGESYESIVQLEKVLELLEADGIAVEDLKTVVSRADTEAIPNDQLGEYIARALLEPVSAETILKQSLQEARY